MKPIEYISKIRYVDPDCPNARFSTTIVASLDFLLNDSLLCASRLEKLLQKQKYNVFGTKKKYVPFNYHNHQTLDKRVMEKFVDLIINEGTTSSCTMEGHLRDYVHTKRYNYRFTKQTHVPISRNNLQQHEFYTGQGAVSHGSSIL